MTRVAGTEGTVWIEGGIVRIADRVGTRELPVPLDLTLPPVSSDGSIQQPAAVGLYTRLCEALRTAIDGEGPASAVPVPTFADGVACMEVLDAIRKSADHQGELVTLSHS
jgi:hypothetical protein